MYFDFLWAEIYDASSEKSVRHCACSVFKATGFKAIEWV